MKLAIYEHSKLVLQRYIVFSWVCRGINTTQLSCFVEKPYSLCANKWLNIKRKSLYVLRPDDKIASGELTIIETI